MAGVPFSPLKANELEKGLGNIWYTVAQYSEQHMEGLLREYITLLDLLLV